MLGVGTDQDIRTAAAKFAELEVTACQKLAEGDHASGLVAAQIAANYAWPHPPGRYASAMLEQYVVAAGTQLLEPAPGAADKGHVLHVMTQAYDVGGHTRLVARWLEQDDTRRHAVVLTYDPTVPAPLRRAVTATRTPVASLRSVGTSLVRRAGELRRLAREADTIVLHTHPWDVLPLLAFGGWVGRPPIMLMDHADHVFWLGVSVADVVLCFRDSGRRLAIERRGVEPHRCIYLPIPQGRVETIPFTTTERANAKAELGVPAGAPVLVTMGSTYRYEVPGRMHLVDLLLPWLDRHPDAVLFALGPSNEGRWAEGRELSHGAIRAVGHKPDPSTFLQAADVYLDSYPCSGGTSTIDASRYGAPVVQFAPDLDEEEFFHTDLVGPPELRCRDDASYRELLDRLLSNPQSRRELGTALAEAQNAKHGESAWTHHLTVAYSTVTSVGPAPLLTRDPPPTFDDPRDHLLTELFRHESYPGLEAIVAMHQRLLVSEGEHD